MKKELIPNSTQTPNRVIDQLMPFLSEGEFKCLMYIVRRTFGFHKEKDRIAFSQFIDGLKKNGGCLDYGTGLSRQTVAVSLERLSALGITIREKSTKGNFYKINLDLDFAKTIQNLDQSKKLTSAESSKEVVKKLDLLGNEGVESSLNIDKKTSQNLDQSKKLTSQKFRPKVVKNLDRNQSKKLTNKRKERKETKREASLKYLLSIPKNDLKKFVENFKVDKKAIELKGRALADYCISSGRRYENYKACLRNALRKDFGERTEEDKNRMEISRKFQAKKKNEERKNTISKAKNLNFVDLFRKRAEKKLRIKVV